MTREEALVQLRLGPGINEDVSEEYNEAVDMAIEVLEQQPSEDWNAVLDELNRIGRNAFKNDTDYDNLFDFISSLPDTKSQSEKRTEERTEMHACDCISREAMLDSLRRYFNDGFDSDKWWNSTYVLDAINKVPSVTPQPKTEQETHVKKGHWIGHREHCERLGVMPSGLGVYEWCSNCDYGIDIRDWSRINHNYCPNCGSYNGGKK